MKFYYSVQEHSLDSEEIFLEIPKNDFRLTVLGHDDYILETKHGELQVVKKLDEFIQTKIQIAEQEAKKAGLDLIVTRVVWKEEI